MALKRASDHFGLSHEVFIKAEIFDPVIGIDSLFFVDPLRLNQTDIPEFKDSLQDIRNHYGRVVELLKYNNSRSTGAAKILVQRKEIKGIGIGYGDKSDDGSAVGPELAERLIVSAKELIEMGITDPAIFEVMGLFENDFGPDRLSDSIISIIQDRVFAYTERVSVELGLPQDYEVNGKERKFLVPTHPSGNKPLLLLPQTILESLPVAFSFGDISAVANFNSELRSKFNSLLAPCFAKSDLTKDTIKKYLFTASERMASLMAAYNSGKPEPYDFENDPEGITSWFEKAQEIVAANPINIPKNPTSSDVPKIVAQIVDSFKNFIENKGGWRGLYDDKKKPLNERHARLLFYATALDYQGTSDLDISPESNAGQGPVDFKFSRGSKKKIVVEVKLSKGKVEQGYNKQTNIYQTSEDAKESYFVVLNVNKPKPESKNKRKKRSQKKTALERLEDKILRQDAEGIQHPNVVIIDATPKLSASKA